MNDPGKPTIRWVSAFESGTDYEADMVRDRLDDSNIPALVFTQRDHTFNVNVGNLAPVYVMVPVERLEEALALIEREDLSASELEDAALGADPNAPAKLEEDVDSLLDSSIERIRFVGPETPENDEEQA